MATHQSDVPGGKPGSDCLEIAGGGSHNRRGRSGFCIISGIPPKRLSFGRFSRFKWIEEPRITFGRSVQEKGGPPDLRAQGLAFLGDGGLWNNLGTHLLREDRLTCAVHGSRN